MELFDDVHQQHLVNGIWYTVYSLMEAIEVLKVDLARAGS